MEKTQGYQMKQSIDFIIELLDDNKKFFRALNKNKVLIDKEIKNILNLDDGGNSILLELSEIVRCAPTKHHPMDQYINSVKINNLEIESNNPLVKIAHYLDMHLEQLDAMISLVHSDNIEQDEHDTLIDNLWFIYEEYSYENKSFLN